MTERVVASSSEGVPPMESRSEHDPTHDDPNALNRLPEWARLVTVFGAPTVCAAFLIWRLISGVEATVALTQTEGRRTQELMLQHIERSDESLITLQQTIGRVLETHTALLRQICISNAKNDAQQRECVR